LFKEFTGMEPDFVDKVKVPPVDVGLKIGKCDGILYTTVRDGVTEKYIHEFKKTSRPVLVSSFDGKQLLLLGGKFDFTERGIVDS